MNWNIHLHKRSDNLLELNVCVLIKDMANYEVSTAESWIQEFQERLDNLNSYGGFSPKHLYKAVIINFTSLTIVKTKADGTFKYKMYTITLNKTS